VYSVERGDDAPGAAAVVTVAAGLGRAALSVAVLDVIWPGARRTRSRSERLRERQ
jgi:hypothetical protein